MPRDSSQGLRFSVQAGDVYDLLTLPTFLPRYTASARALMAAAKAGFDPVKHAHPARHVKVRAIGAALLGFVVQPCRA